MDKRRSGHADPDRHGAIALSLWPYISILGIIIISGFGVPIPEETPLLLAGVFCGTGQANIWVMLPLCFTAVMGADAVVYWLGRKYGHHVPKLPLMRRFLTPKRLATAEAAFHRHGGKTLFVCRFLPGIRAPMLFTAGTFRIPYWKFLLFDGSAACMSVPWLVLLPYWFIDDVEKIRHMAHEVQIGIAVGVVLLIALFFVIRRWALGSWLGSSSPSVKKLRVMARRRREIERQGVVTPTNAKGA